MPLHMDFTPAIKMRGMENNNGSLIHRWLFLLLRDDVKNLAFLYPLRIRRQAQLLILEKTMWLWSTLTAKKGHSLENPGDWQSQCWTRTWGSWVLVQHQVPLGSLQIPHPMQTGQVPSSPSGHWGARKASHYHLGRHQLPGSSFCCWYLSWRLR